MIKETFRTYLEEAIGSDNVPVAFSAFEDTPHASVRMNPYKPAAGMEGERICWNEHGILLHERPIFTLDPLFHCGAYYVQDSSSMFVGHMFRECVSLIDIPETRPIRVLDLCAAPGGKATDIAASLRGIFGDRFILVANEVMKQRAGVLADNIAIWGDPNVVVTSDDPSAFASLDGYFDVVVADVPCSGEGMFRKDLKAQAQWSEDNVALCAARQKRIIADVWPALKKGGLMIYSTCTFNRYENDLNVGWIMDELGADSVRPGCAWESEGVIRTNYGYSLVPGHVRGEGQYCAALVKSARSSGHMSVKERARNNDRPAQLPGGLKTMMNKDVSLRMKGDMITAVPSECMSDVSLLESFTHVIAAGCAMGVFKGGTFVPDADLALSVMLADGTFPSVDVDRKTALEYLHKDAIRLDGAPKGYVMIRYDELPLGFVKNLGNRCNNLYPQGRRIRMDIDK